MAITDTNQPARLTPVYNPVVYMAESSNTNKKGFRYIFDVYGTSNEFIITQKVIPNLDGLGVVDFSKILSSYVTYDHKDFSSAGVSQNSFKRIFVRVGEEYYEEVNYLDYNYLHKTTYNPPFNPNNLNSFTTLITSTLPPYIDGDYIFITQTSSNPTIPQINGNHRVLDVIVNPNNPSQWMIILDLPWLGSSVGAEPGTIRYSDNRKSSYPDLHSYSEVVVWNGVLLINDFTYWKINNIDEDYIMADDPISTEKKFLSIIADEYTLREDNRIVLQYAQWGTDDPPRYLRFESDDGTIYDTTLSLSNNHRLNTINVGTNRTNWGTLIAGTAPAIKPDTKWYSIQLLQTDKNQTISKKIKFNIERKCVVDNLEVMWLDSMGSFLNFNFNLINDKQLDIHRDTFIKENGKYDYNNWNEYIIDEFGYGKNVYNSYYRVKYKLRTDFLDKEKEALFYEMIKSPIIFINFNDDIRSGIINTNSISISSKRRGVKQFELEVELTNDYRINI